MNNMKETRLSNWLEEYEQVFQLKETRLSLRRKRMDYVINLKKPESKPSFLISTKLEEQ